MVKAAVMSSMCLKLEQLMFNKQWQERGIAIEALRGQGPVGD